MPPSLDEVIADDVDSKAQIASKLVAPEPEHCPGSESTEAGKADACAGCPNQQICATTPTGPDADLPLIGARLASVRHKIVVLSGKGGVGKSTVSTLLAQALAAAGGPVGLMDADICGPSIPRMTGVEEERIHVSGAGWSPVWASERLAVMSVQFMLPARDEAVVWRGPKKNGLIRRFLRDVDWGELEYLLVDTPPGTSDEHLSLAAFLRAAAGLRGALLVTTPQEVALLDVRKQIDFCRKAAIPILGLVENMSTFVCPNCRHQSRIFAPSTGGGAALARDLCLPYLGAVPLDPRIGMACDYGENFLESYPDSPATKAFMAIAAALSAAVEAAA